MVLRLGYCSNCREPISSEILPDAKKQALVQSEREYEQMRDRLRQEKDRQSGESLSIDISDLGGGFGL